MEEGAGLGELGGLGGGGNRPCAQLSSELNIRMNVHEV